MMQEYNDILEKMVRDFTEVSPRMKSEVRQRIQDYAVIAYRAGQKNTMNTKHCKNCKEDYDVTLALDRITCPECETPFEPIEQTNYVHVSRTCCPKCGADSMNGVEHECSVMKELKEEEVPSEDWRVKFEKLWEKSFDWDGEKQLHEYNELVDFIRQTRQEAVEKYKREFKKIIMDSVYNEVVPEENACRDENCPYKKGFNLCRSKVVDKFKEMGI